MSSLYPRDSQRAKVYNWEHSAGLTNPKVTMSFSDCVKLANGVWRMYGNGADMPRIRQSRAAGACFAWGTTQGKLTTYEIKINLMMQRAEVVLHEVAHALLFAHTKARYAAHGPEFMGLYIELLYTMMGKDDIALTKSARARGISVMAFERIDMTSINKPLYSY
jgi:hypothetical protein